MMYKVKINNSGDSLMQIKTKDGEFTVDVSGDGVTSPDMLLASLGSCIGVYIQKYAKGTNIKIEGFDIEVSAEFQNVKPIRFNTINATISLKNSGISEKEKESLLRFVHNCPIHNTLKNPSDIHIAIQ